LGSPKPKTLAYLFLMDKNIETMMNIAELTYEIPCPSCRHQIAVSMQEIANQSVLDCTDCHQRIRVVDEDGATKKGIRSVNRILKNLDNQLAKLCV